eukprot:6178551-Pleurochrysis_carterae.AAC.3
MLSWHAVGIGPSHEFPSDPSHEASEMGPPRRFEYRARQSVAAAATATKACAACESRASAADDGGIADGSAAASGVWVAAVVVRARESLADGAEREGDGKEEREDGCVEGRIAEEAVKGVVKAEVERVAEAVVVEEAVKEGVEEGVKVEVGL